MTDFYHTLATIVSLGVSSIFAIYLAYDSLTAYFYRKATDFQALGWFLVFLDLFSGLVLLLLGVMLPHAALKSLSFLFLACFSFGSMWLLYMENSMPSLPAKVFHFLLTLAPFAILVTFPTPISAAHLLDGSMTTHFLLWNLISTCGLFLLWALSYGVSRLRMFDLYAATSYVFYAFGAVLFLFGTDFPFVTGAAILYLLGTLSFSYTWVKYE